MKSIITILAWALALQAFAQKEQIQGVVKTISEHETEQQDDHQSEEHEKHAHLEPLPGASIYWLGTSTGTVTGMDGKFTINVPEDGANKLVVSFVGHQNDTLTITSTDGPIEIILSTGTELDEVLVHERNKGVYLSKVTPIQTEIITSSGLTRLACCNLSESFENNATVDVGYTDAVSGARQIKMLGLAGVYSQLLSENIPSIRGLATTYGLNYIPGPWMESIQISKGTASVVNGYESVTGQINVEYKKPKDSPPLYLNIYGNNFGKGELNINSAFDVNEDWSTMLMAHGSIYNNVIDYNQDGFLDIPKNSQINIYNRWNYVGHNGRGQVGFKALDENRTGGQKVYFTGNEQEKNQAYFIDINTRRYQAYAKRGFLLDDNGSSLGLKFSASYFDQNTTFGNNAYHGTQESYYANAVYQAELAKSHTLTSGIGYQYDHYNETFNDTVFKRTESVPGVFSEYSFSVDGHFNFITGIRYDYNSHYGNLLTPRVHLKWNINEHTVVRGSAGRGYRPPNIFAENLGIMASSRNLIFEDDFDIEEAWNYGLNASHDFHLFGASPLIFTIDFYRTTFINKVVVDFDQDFNEVHFYNLSGKSFSNSFQTGLDMEPVKHLQVTLAYRLNDVKTTFNGALKAKPFVKKHKGLVSISYSTNNNNWQFDATNQFAGRSRLPYTGDNPAAYQRRAYSPAHYILHAQITRKINHFEIYLGGENLTGFKQNNPIIASEDPFGRFFDSSFTWGPLVGRKIYAGIRYEIK